MGLRYISSVVVCIAALICAPEQSEACESGGGSWDLLGWSDDGRTIAVWFSGVDADGEQTRIDVLRDGKDLLSIANPSMSARDSSELYKVDVANDPRLRKFGLRKPRPSSKRSYQKHVRSLSSEYYEFQIRGWGEVQHAGNLDGRLLKGWLHPRQHVAILHVAGGCDGDEEFGLVMDLAKDIVLCDSLACAAATNDLGRAKTLISRKRVNRRDRLGRSPLHYAASHGNSELVELLLSRGANVGARTSVGYTALHLAAFYDAVQVAPVLLKHGARIDARTPLGFTAADFTQHRTFGNTGQHFYSIPSPSKSYTPAQAPSGNYDGPLYVVDLETSMGATCWLVGAS